MGRITCRSEEKFHHHNPALGYVLALPHTSTNIQQDPSFTSASISLIYDDFPYISLLSPCPGTSTGLSHTSGHIFRAEIWWYGNDVHLITDEGHSPLLHSAQLSHFLLFSLLYCHWPLRSSDSDIKGLIEAGYKSLTSLRQRDKRQRLQWTVWRSLLSMM